eukprot:CAMPEP_0206178902 /NCGR_PEP_ID=MMETSP1474-20131121/65774_1 /ASSEMBLY_ACC=CAM_ASM_001110 /TAXON_ID=97495 /ORGANISM="Imantonia sp., Strain RCC918" /LENGTH=46 /DNA_ID= /DNA_START= /DNA_END= /DNA_ORIENTATION=
MCTAAQTRRSDFHCQRQDVHLSEAVAESHMTVAATPGYDERARRHR